VLYKANGELWNPHYEKTEVLDELLRRIVDALRYRRTQLGTEDAYGRAVAGLIEAATHYTTQLRANPAAAGPVPRVPQNVPFLAHL
jgi:hypothetical protein